MDKRSVPTAGSRGLSYWPQRIWLLPTQVLLSLISLYQKVLSPILPAVFGPSCGCRFTPSCSHYAAEALLKHGFFQGLALAIVRLVKCTPLHSGGFDPVPVRNAQPVCSSARSSGSI